MKCAFCKKIKKIMPGRRICNDCLRQLKKDMEEIEKK